MADTDPLLDRFSDLNWPGKRQPVNRADTKPDTEDTGLWDEKPVSYLFGGTQREFFTISHLATALGKSPVTIRSWEHKELIPKTPYRSPRPRGEMLPGVAPKGMRLWTRDQVVGILAIAREEQVILNGKPPTKRFYDRVLDLYKNLLKRDS